MNEKLKELRDQKLSLEKEIISLRENSLHDMNESEDWIPLIQSKELMISNIKKEICKLQSTLKQEFLKDIHHRRSKNAQEVDVFKIALKDAEETAYNIVTLNPEDIAHFFSTKYQIIEPKGSVRPTNKFYYQWFFPLDHRNIIPLSPGIEIPQRVDRNGMVKDVIFTMERFFKNKKFVQKCKDYYNIFNLNLDIFRDKNYKLRRYWIKIYLKNDGVIYFNQ